MSGVLTAGIGLVLVVLAGVIGFAIYASWRVYHPRPPRAERFPGDVGLAENNVRFPAEDGLAELAGWLFEAEKPSRKGKTILLCHQWGAHKSFLLRYVLAYLERGYGCLVFDLRNHGDSDRLTNLRPQSRFFTSDIRGAIRFARDHNAFHGNDLILHGFSFSTFPVSVACLHEEGADVDRVILECGPTVSTRQILEGILDSSLLALGGIDPLFSRYYFVANA